MVVGAIDGSHLPMIAPFIDEYAYVSRKQYHSINMRAICDSNLIFQDVAGRWPGSHHDSLHCNPPLSMTDLKTTSLETVGFWATADIRQSNG